MKVRHLLIALVAMIGFVAAPQSFADQKSQPKCTCMMQMRQMMDGLNLTADQKQKIQAMKQTNRSKMMSDMEQMKVLRVQMHNMAMSDKMDEAAMDQMISKKSALMADMMKMRMMFKNQVYMMLTPDQKMKYRQAMENMHKNCKKCNMHSMMKKA